MYDYTHIKERIHEEMECIADHCHWKPEYVCIMRELLSCAKHIEEIEKLEWEEEERCEEEEMEEMRMRDYYHKHKAEHGDMTAESVSATGVVVKKA